VDRCTDGEASVSLPVEKVLDLATVTLTKGAEVRQDVHD